MNILIVSPAFPPFSGVGGMRMNSLSQYIRDKKDKVTVLRNTPDFWGEDNLKEKVPNGVNIVDVLVKKNMIFEQYENEYYKVISNICLHDQVDIIIYSVGPFYTLKTAPKIKKKFGVKYIIDFRDLWIFEKKSDVNLIKKVKRYISLFPYKEIEKNAIEDANKIVVVTPGDKEILLKKYNLTQTEVITIFNGYNEIDNYQEYIQNNDIYTISNLGKLGYYSEELTEMLFKTLKNFTKNTSPIKINHIGNNEDFTNQLVKKYEDKNLTYNCTGYVSYNEGISILKNANASLIIYSHPTGLGTKVFDYIACDKPIILLTKKENSLSKFVNKFKHGFVCHNEQDIIHTLKYLIKNKISYLDEKKNLFGYSREDQNKIYYNLIKKL